MKKAMISIFLFIISISQTMAGAESFPDQEIRNRKIVELKPSQIISFEEFRKEDVKTQKQFSGVWSTVNRTINLNSLSVNVFTSSILGKTYSGPNLFDNNIATAWVEGVKGDGVGQWVKISIKATLSSPTTTPFSIIEFGLIPGFAKNQTTWKENNRVKTVMLVVYSPYYINYPENRWVVLRLRCKDENKLQIFKIPSNMLTASMDSMVKIVWIRIESVYPGSKYQDTCISEVVFAGGCSS